MTILEQVLGHLGVVVLQGNDAGAFIPQSPMLPWFEQLFVAADGTLALPGESSFLEFFLEDAGSFWEAGLEGSLHEGPWAETSKGEEFVLTVDALPGRVLLIRHSPHEHAAAQGVLQAARETSLRYERVEKKVQNPPT